MPPGSDVASLSILGYDPKEYYRGRGPLEAVSLGIHPATDDRVFRCNLVSVSEGLMQDYSAGHISTKEAKVLIESLNKKIRIDGVSFYSGVSYRHVATIRDSLLQEGKGELLCVPPHAIIAQPIEPNLPSGRGSPLLRELMENSQAILSAEAINQVKIDLQEDPANMIWLWGGGKLEVPPSFHERFGVKGTVIAAVDLIKGIGKLIGLQIPAVAGATGYYDTDYDAKASAAAKALETEEFVVIHVEAADEAGHNADILQKITAIERFDAKIVGKIMEDLEQWGEYRVVALPDHFTPISMRNHTPEPVPFVMAGKGIAADGVQVFDEFSVNEGDLGKVQGHELMPMLFTLDKGKKGD
jgi:2,3-bisphosphoglycerate-independent phosphoglycerate mutase